MPSVPLIAAWMCFLAFTAAAEAGAGNSIFNQLWEAASEEGCDKYPVSAIVSTYADGEELLTYGIYNTDVKSDYYAGPKLEYLRNITTFSNSEWCAGKDTTPIYIDSNSVQKFDIGQRSGSTASVGIPQVHLYLKILNTNNKRINCTLKLSLIRGAASALTKERGCEGYPNLQILSYYRTQLVEESSTNLDGNAFWVYWNDSKTARPAGVGTAFGPNGGPAATAPVKPAPIKNQTETGITDSASSSTTTASSAAAPAYVRLGFTALMVAVAILATAII